MSAYLVYVQETFFLLASQFGAGLTVSYPDLVWGPDYVPCGTDTRVSVPVARKFIPLTYRLPYKPHFFTKKLMQKQQNKIKNNYITKYKENKFEKKL